MKDKGIMDESVGERAILKEEGENKKLESCDLGKESVLDGIEMEEEHVVTDITPVKVMKGLSIEDYPREWSMKKIKREIKAKRNAMEYTAKKKKKPP